MVCDIRKHILKPNLFFLLLFVLYPSSTEADLAPKREGPPGEATALEALLRGDNALEKKTNVSKDEETLLEIQVTLNQPSI